MATDPLGDDLAAFAAEPVELLATEPDGSYLPPDNADDANRLLRRLRSHQTHRDELLDRYDAELRMLTAWRDDRLAGIDRDVERLSLSLEAWMRDREAQTGVVTEHLPAGELWLRRSRPSIVVTDEQAAVDWSNANDVQVRTKTEVNKTALAAEVAAGPAGAVSLDAGPDHEYRPAVTATGEVVPGVLIRRPVRGTFTVHSFKENHDEH